MEDVLEIIRGFEMVLLEWSFVEKIVVALAIGALIGMERQHTKHQEIVGLRTFALVSLLGTLSVIFSELTGTMLQVILGFIAIALFCVVLYASNLLKLGGVGLTTTIALLLSYVLGVFVGFGRYTEAIFVTISVTIVLFARARLHEIVKNITDRELLDFLEFLAIVGLVYPLLPKEPLTYIGLKMDFHILWLLIVIISVMNLVGFIGSRIFSAERQLFMMSFLGGLVSSKAINFGISSTYGHRKIDVVTPAYLIINGSSMIRNLVILGIFVPAAMGSIFIPTLVASLFLILVGSHLMKKTKGVRLLIKSPFGVPKAVELAIKLFVVLIALEMITISLPNIFYLAVFFGSIVSSASTMASISTMNSLNHISFETTLLASSIVMLGSLLFGNLIVLYMSKAWRSAKKSMPYTIIAAGIFVVLLFFFMK